MRPLKIIGRIFLIIFLIGCFVLTTMLCEGYQITNSIKKINKDISIWQRQRNEIYSMEQTGFIGVVTDLSHPIHRHTIDTVTVKLSSWVSPDTSFLGNYYLQNLQKPNDSTLLLFITYSESIRKPNQIDIGDKVIKEQFGFDFSIYDTNQLFKKKLSLLFCSYENPDTIIQKENFLIGLYGDKPYILFSGAIDHGKRNGDWRYYEANTNNYKIFEGQYKDDKRNGTFRKYYRLTDQLIYEENYRDNLPNGQFTWWFSNGQLESKKYYDQGKPIGIWEFYDDKGRLIKTENY